LLLSPEVVGALPPAVGAALQGADPALRAFKGPTPPPGPNPLSGAFELGHLKLNAIEKERKKDVWLRAYAYGNYIAILGRRMVEEKTIDEVQYGSFSVSTDPKRVAESDWVSWLDKWGKCVQQIIVPTDVLKEIKEIKEI